MPKLLIVCATEFEAAGFIDGFSNLDRSTFTSGGRLYSTRHWHCLVTGPGVVNTAMALGAYLEQHRPELILDTGIAGAFESCGLGIGDIALASGERYLHCGVGNDVLALTPLPFDLIDGEPATRKGIYPFDPVLVGQWKIDFQDNYLQNMGDSPGTQILIGDFVTVSGLTSNKTCARKIYQAFSPVMESMEGAAVAHVARCCGLPMVEIRAASNLAGDRDKLNWDFARAAAQVSRICRAAVDLFCP